MNNYKQAIVVFKHLLQAAWCYDSFQFEMKAYEMLGKQYYYLHDLKKADYYFDRFMRGKFELKDSKIRILNLTQLQSKNDQRVLKNMNNEGVSSDVELAKRINQFPYKLKQIQTRSRDGFYKLVGIEQADI